MISIHKALASLDDSRAAQESFFADFNPQGSREPRLSTAYDCQEYDLISIHKALASLDYMASARGKEVLNFNPQGSREPRPFSSQLPCEPFEFQSTRLSRASTTTAKRWKNIRLFQSTRLSRASTGIQEPRSLIHQFQSTRLSRASTSSIAVRVLCVIFQSTRLSRASTKTTFNPLYDITISIHKALASLDSKIIQNCSTSPLTFYALCSSLPSSTNSVHSPSPLSQPFPLFFRCESPWHFMSAWHSHLV